MNDITLIVVLMAFIGAFGILMVIQGLATGARAIWQLLMRRHG